MPIISPYYITLELPSKREFIFKPKKLDKLLVYAYIISYNLSYIFIRNNTNEEIKLPKNIKLGYITKYEATEYFLVEAYYSDLTTRAPRKIIN